MITVLLCGVIFKGFKMTAKSQRYSFLDSGIISKGLANEHRPLKIFDWNKAAELIKASKANIAEAGLSGDWDYTGGVIYEDGKPVSDEYTYLASTWATPTLIIDGKEHPCYTDESSGFTESTKWPISALEILNT
jgi:hypothetical protein